MGLNVPLPDGLPFNICVPTNFLEETCVSADDLVFGGTRTCYSCYIGGYCSSYSTPPLVSTDFTLAEYEYGYFGDVDVTTDISAWIGIETDLSAIWIGVGGGCAKEYIDPPDISSTDDIRDVMDEIRDWGEWVVEELEDLKYPSPNIDAVEIIIAFIVFILYVILTVITGGAIGS